MFQDLRKYIATELNVHREERDLLLRRHGINFDDLMINNSFDQVPPEVYKEIIAVSVYADIANFMDHYPSEITSDMDDRECFSTMARLFFEKLFTREQEHEYRVGLSTPCVDMIDEGRLLIRDWYLDENPTKEDDVRISEGNEPNDAA